ncbi:precorrin-6y C5,15-methyltransferase (decarboxylating) subunit CbiE [Granulicoccus sp. GXG6511]|uniref:precorrin-6y C5,15-methyltransferase (decarboxylating) subunit CbiE n=1 Tax=Granulicoccus sp. GXG6511 TaxID=3381351 RepID=UPI003D7D7A95
MIDVVGMGAEGPDSCTESGRRALAEAEVILGGARQLALAAKTAGDAELIEWPSPLRAGLPGLLARCAGRRVAAVASGDPLVAGIGSTLIEILGAEAVRIHPAVSSVALARARMGWSADEVDLLRLRADRDVDALRRLLAPGRRILVLSADETSPAAVAAVCWDAGVPGARLTILGNLGTEDEYRRETTATGLAVESTDDVPRLNIVAVECAAGERPVSGWLAPGLPDEAFEHDGQLTKRHVRTAALAALQPAPGELLWDLGAGAGSVGIEWARLHRANRVAAVEQDRERADRIARNACTLGVPHVAVTVGSSLTSLAELPDPDAIFVGGGVSPDLLSACWDRLPARGRLVVHGVTLETEALLLDHHARLGGDLVRLEVSTAGPLGSRRGWQPARPVVQWAVTKPASAVERDT